ncbi:MAG: ribosome assembly cofactor RimP [Porphyromonadaceae bacterium]|nr:ribosome assembly cofactor RimP [Porphyromonadaceae bacterium]
MIDKDLLRQVVEEKLAMTDCFLVGITISNDNSIVVEIDSETSVDLNFCVELTRYIEQHFDREKEDYSLEIGSYSITNPFVDKRQYIKNIGRSVEVLTDDSKKIKGTLIEASDNGFVVETEIKELLEGQKRKKTVKKQILFLYNNVKKTKLDF